jgi:hypothetical protein
MAIQKGHKALSAPAQVMRCSCISPMQDRIHGKGMRAHNPCPTSDPFRIKYRCTVCSNEKV